MDQNQKTLARIDAIERDLLLGLDSKSPTELSDFAVRELQWALAELRDRVSPVATTVRPKVAA